MHTQQPWNRISVEWSTEKLRESQEDRHLALTKIQPQNHPTEELELSQMKKLQMDITNS